MNKAFEYAKSTLGLAIFLGVITTYITSLAMLAPVLQATQGAQVAGINESEQELIISPAVEKELVTQVLPNNVVRVLVPANFSGQQNIVTITNTSLQNSKSVVAAISMPTNLASLVYINLSANGSNYRLSGPGAVANRQVTYNLQPNTQTEFSIIIKPQSPINYAYSFDINLNK